MRSKQTLIIAVLLGIALIGFSGYYFLQQKSGEGSNKPSPTSAIISTFEECAKRGYPVQESYPRKCSVPGGPTFTEVVTPAPSDVAVPSERATVTPRITQAEKNITVTSPQANTKIVTGNVVRGQARVFENVLQYRLKDAMGTVLVQGKAEAASPDIGQFGPYAVTLQFTQPTTPTGVLEVFSYSAKDGSEINKVTVPVQF